MAFSLALGCPPWDYIILTPGCDENNIQYLICILYACKVKVYASHTNKSQGTDINVKRQIHTLTKHIHPLQNPWTYPWPSFLPPHLGSLNVWLRVKSIASVGDRVWTLDGNQGPDWIQANINVNPSGPFQVQVSASMPRQKCTLLTKYPHDCFISASLENLVLKVVVFK